MNYYTATAIFQDAEIGYGEGESDAYAVDECVDSIDGFFKLYSGNDIRLVVRRPTGEIAYVTSLAKYRVDTGAL